MAGKHLQQATNTFKTPLNNFQPKVTAKSIKRPKSKKYKPNYQISKKLNKTKTKAFKIKCFQAYTT